MVQPFFGQHKTKADRFFEKGDFINAALYYEAEIATARTKKATERAAISYYNTFQYRKAALYLKQLINGRFVDKDKNYDNSYNFKLYQVLSALGDYETALDYFKIYKENLNVTIQKTEAINTIETFKLKTPDFKIKKALFNSDVSDFGAVRYGDSVYFVSDRKINHLLGKTYKWTHEPFLDVYAVKIDEKNNPVGDIVGLPKPINSKLHDGNFCFTKDGNTLYISKSNTNEGKKEFNAAGANNIHIYKASRVDGKWSALEKLAFNTNGFSFQHPALSPDETKLYFSSNMAGGYGGFDLYYVDISSDGIMGMPVNLGSTINTENREHFPFVSERGNLFFASNGHLGLGMLDNFVSEWVDGAFAKPVNLGVPINSRYDDFNLNYYDESQGFFSSNRLNNTDNIFSFQQIGEIFPREYINMFEVRDAESKAYVAHAKVEVHSSLGSEIYKNTLDSLAFFNLNLLPGNYTFKAKCDLYYDATEIITVQEKQEQVHVIYLKHIPPPKPVTNEPLEQIIAEKQIDKTLKDKDPERFALLTDVNGPPVIEKDGKLFFKLEPIYFDFDMWAIRSDSKKILDALAAKLERYPKVHLKISAHTDSRGTARYNQILSERRAEATRNYLALEGYINARRMKFQGFGESMPIAPCPMLDCTDEEHQLNRRSEFEIIDY